jgi:hypothetical protein
MNLKDTTLEPVSQTSAVLLLESRLRLKAIVVPAGFVTAEFVFRLMEESFQMS